VPTSSDGASSRMATPARISSGLRDGKL
jgi:hypothetical protein